MSFAALDSLDWPVFEPGTVWLVGAGPGAPGLLTLLGYYGLGHADVVLSLTTVRRWDPDEGIVTRL